jgi:hypothetical protein
MAWKKRSNRLPPFVPLTWELLNSKAYRDLPASAGKALPFFIGKVKTRYNDPQRYSIEFELSYTEAQRYGFAVATHHRTIRELMAKGFIDPADKGGLRGLGCSSNRFTLSSRWKDYGNPGFVIVEWRRFEPRYRSKATSKKKNDSIKNEKNTAVQAANFSNNDAVSANLS